jgi:hypothetical protein
MVCGLQGFFLPSSCRDPVKTDQFLSPGKAEQQARRNEKLAHKNPDRLQKQLDDLKALQASGGKLTAHEQRVIEELERDVKAVRKAREALGDKAPPLRGGFGGGDRGGRDGGRGGGVLGKRRRDWEHESDESDVPEDVKAIPMPRDTPPPIPKDVLDKWYQKRRELAGHGARHGQGTSANNVPLGGTDRTRQAAHLDGIPERPAVPIAPAQTVYEAKPVIRDLRKEAISAFMPAAVRAKMEKSKGLGGLVEPEEADRLEKEGYLAKSSNSGNAQEEGTSSGPRGVMMEEVEDEDD